MHERVEERDTVLRAIVNCGPQFHFNESEARDGTLDIVPRQHVTCQNDKLWNLGVCIPSVMKQKIEDFRWVCTSNTGLQRRRVSGHMEWDDSC